MIPWVAGSESPRNRARKTGQIPATNIYRFETPNANQARPAKKATQKINPVIAMQAISGSQSNSEVQALTDRYHKGLMTDDEFLEKRKALADQRTEEETNALPVAETVQSIKVGTRTAYSCTGRPSGKLYTYKVTQLQDGVVYYEKFKDGKRARYVRPLWAIGTNLFHKNNYSDGKGDREQKFDVRDFQGLGEHNSGTSFGGTVRESHSRSSWKWRYTIKIGERYRMNHELLGDVEVVEIHENRKIVGKAYSSRTNSKITPSIAGLTLSWAYEDERGTQNCWLTKFEH